MATIPTQASNRVYQRRQILFGALTQAEFLHIVRTRCIQEEAENLEAAMTEWRQASAEFQQLVRNLNPSPDEVRLMDLGKESKPTIDRLMADPLFRATFSQHEYNFKLVEIDKLISPQREVDLDYVEQIAVDYGKDLSEAQLADICLAPQAPSQTPAFQQLAANVIVYSSQHPGLRFLHGFPKRTITEEDIALALAGGQPVAAVVLFVGYGTNPVNVLAVGNRLILNNGFHRAYTLRNLGVEYMPAVIQIIHNPDLEMAPQIVGLPKEYLIGHQRPVIVGDFFQAGLTKILRIKPTIKHVKLQWGWEEYPGPAVIPEA